MNLPAELEQLLRRKDLRSADRASMRAMATKVKRGEALNYQERQNLWAYIDRYSRIPDRAL